VPPASPRVVKYGSKTRRRASGVNPGPLSSTAISTMPRRSRDSRTSRRSARLAHPSIASSAFWITFFTARPTCSASQTTVVGASRSITVTATRLESIRAA